MCIFWYLYCLFEFWLFAVIQCSWRCPKVESKMKTNKKKFVYLRAQLMLNRVKESVILDIPMCFRSQLVKSRKLLLPKASHIRHSGNICRHGESKRYRFNSHNMNNAYTCRVGDGVRVRASKYTIKIVLAKITSPCVMYYGSFLWHYNMLT